MKTRPILAFGALVVAAASFLVRQSLRSPPTPPIAQSSNHAIAQSPLPIAQSNNHAIAQSPLPSSPLTLEPAPQPQPPPAPPEVSQPEPPPAPPPPSRPLESELLSLLPTASGADRDALLHRLADLAALGFFDSALASLDWREIDAGQFRWSGPPRLVEAARKIVSEEPVWQHLLRLSKLPNAFDVESRVDVQPLPAYPYTVVVPGYRPATVHGKVRARGLDGWLGSASGSGKTPSAVPASADPYLYAEILVLRRNLLEIAVRRVRSLPVDLRRRDFILLVAHLAFLDFNSEDEKELQSLLADVARNHAPSADVLVSALGSRMPRMPERCAPVLKSLGASAVPALLRGLSHPDLAVRREAAVRLRIDAKPFLPSRADDVVARSLETLRDPAYLDAYPQTLFLLRDLGPRAGAALPLLEDWARFHERISVQNAARDAAAAIRL